MFRPLLAASLAFATVATLTPSAHAGAPADAPADGRVADAPSISVPDPADAGAYVGVGMLAGVNRYSYSGAMFQAGSGIGSLPVFARFALSGGLATTWNEEAGWYIQTRIGLELRHCFANTRTCAFGGIDTGISNARYPSPDEPMTSEEALGFVGVARGGVELQAGPVRVRAALEAMTIRPIFSPGRGDGLALDLTAFHAF